MGAVYRLTLRQLSGRWRLAIITVVAALPVLITLLTMQASGAPDLLEFERNVLGAMLIGSVTPLVVLALAGAALSNEVEDRTLANLVLSPIPRWQIVVPKLLAAITIAAPFMAASALGAGAIAFLGDAGATASLGVATLIAVALYAAVFLWLGLVTTQVIGIGLLYIVLWEGVLSNYITGVRLLSVRHHAIALMHGLDTRRFVGADHVDAAVAALAVVAMFGALLLLTTRRLRRMDVP